VVPHPPNFTPIIALSFYIPAILGSKFFPFYLFSYILIDLFFGFHDASFFVWGSIIFISLISKYLGTLFITRIFGVIGGSIIFFILTNFGVWTSGYYGYTLAGLISCYIAAIPFFGNTLVATIIYASLIELIIKLFFPNSIMSKRNF
tara:strand:+ start:801 stop:1241 length:441 start_codon:yes stop_codon:yes gene_type:complete